jgi:hypothetical protein
MRVAAAMGYAALLPGMQKMLDLMQRQVDDMRARLAELQAGPVARQSGSEKTRRRIKTAAKKKAKKMHPRDPQHPEHAKWAKSVGGAITKAWASMTVKQRKQRLAKMRAGRKTAKLARAA